MNRITVGAHALFMLAALGLAFWTTSTEQVRTDARGDINILDIEKKDLQKVSYTWPDGDLTLNLVGQKKQKNVYATLEHERSGPEKKEWLQETGKKSDDPGIIVPKKTYRFPANDSVKKSLSRLTPFLGKRSLGTVSQDALTQMGLLPIKRTLKITWTRGEASFDIGESTYGDRARYVRRSGKEEVYLVPGAVIKGLEGPPPRLQEARAFGLDLATVKKMVLEAKGEPRAYTLFNPDDAKNRFFAREGSSEKDPLTTNLIRTLRTLRIVRYLESGDLETLKPEFKIRFEFNDIDDLEVAIFTSENAPKYRAMINGFPALLDENRGARAAEELQEIFDNAP